MNTYELKTALKEMISEFHVSGLPPFYRRDIKVPEFKRINKIITLVGPRRAGKTYLLYQIMKSLLNKGHEITDFVYINFENERLFGIKAQDLHNILKAYTELYPRKKNKPILFFDEIQNVPNWELFVRGLHDRGYKIYVTGSNSKLLSREIASSLRGRATSVEVFPLSFREFLTFRGIELKENWEYSQASLIKSLFDKYMNTSGFPEIVLEDRLGIIDDYFKTIFYHDVIDRYRIKNMDLMEFLMNYLIRIYSQEFSINKFHHLAKAQGYKSSTSVVHNYIRMLKEVYFAFLVTQRRKGKKEFTYSKKSYLVDHGFINYYVVNKDLGRLLENIVFLHLRRKNNLVYFYKDRYECDFLTSKAYQVTYVLNDDNYKREIGGLTTACQRFKLRGRIITYDTEDTVRVGSRSIPVIPIWKWLLKE